MRVLMLLGCAAALAAPPVYAQSAPAPSAASVGLTAEQADVDPRAVEALKAMSTYLSSLQSFRLVSDGSLDVITAGDQKVLRGGSWDIPSDHRSAARGFAPPSDARSSIGFRVVLAPPIQP